MNKSIKPKSRKNNNANPKISVLIPCHNIENNSYFSLESVLKNS
ncbi:glycosyltransferase family 2 protein, partial [Escherichia coli]|nr:glycosyltransferase family 2 protein [Escherichia coli]